MGPGTVFGLHKWVRTGNKPNISNQINQSLIFPVGNIQLYSAIELFLVVFTELQV